jgi:hypothetical protein
MKSNVWYPRLTAAMILSGSAVHTKGLGSSLVSFRKRLMMFLQRSLRGRDDAYTTKLGIDQPHQRDLTEITSAPIT